MGDQSSSSRATGFYEAADEGARCLLLGGELIQAMKQKATDGGFHVNVDLG